MSDLTLSVSGMSCGGCSGSIKRVCEALEGVTECTASHETGAVVVTGPAVDAAAVTAAITKAGFEVAVA